jgi:hypothetical protein
MDPLSEVGEVTIQELLGEVRGDEFGGFHATARAVNMVGNVPHR